MGYAINNITSWADLVARTIRASGGRAGHMVHIADGWGLFTGGLGARCGAEHLGCTVIPVKGGQTEKQVKVQVQLIEDFKPQFIMISPSCVQEFIEECTRQGLDARDHLLQIGIFGAEPWINAVRRNLALAASLEAVDISS